MADVDTSALRAVLPGISDSSVKSPFEFANQMSQAQKNALDVQKAQSEKIAGQLAQQAIGPDGKFDPDKYNALLAATPGAAQSAFTSMKDTSALRGASITQNLSINDHVNAAVTAALASDDANIKQAVIEQANRLRAILPPGQVDAALLGLRGDNPAELRKQLETIRVGTLPPQQKQDWTYGRPITVETGGATQGATQNPRTGAIITSGQGVPKTLSPESTVQAGITYPATQEDVTAGRAKSVGETVHLSGADVLTRFGLGGLLPQGARIDTSGGGGTGGGVVNSDGTSVTVKPPRLLNVPAPTTPAPAPAPAAPATPAGPPAPPGGHSGASSAPYTGGGIGAVLSHPGASTAAPAPATPVPAVPPAVTAPVPAPRAAIQGGVPVASTNALLAPTVGAASAPSPLVAGDVNAIMQGMERARGTAAPGTQVAGASFATGAGYDEQVTAKVSQERLASDTALAANYASNVFPQTQALALLGRGMTTAPTTDLMNTAKGWAGGVARSMGFNGVFDETKEYDSLHKWLSQIVAGNPVAQGSDARLAATLAGNANTGIHELASSDMLKAGIALMRMNATASSEWQSNPAVRRQYGYYTNYLRDFNKTVDPRAFAWDMYNPAQKKDLLADIDKHDEAYAQRLRSSLQMVRRNGYMGETRAMP